VTSRGSITESRFDDFLRLQKRIAFTAIGTLPQACRVNCAILDDFVSIDSQGE